MTAASIGRSDPAAISEALSSISQEVQTDGLGGWRLRSPGPAALAIQARIDGPWALFRHAAANNGIHGLAIARCGWELLSCNTQLRGPAKFGMNPTGTHVELSAEVLLAQSEIDLPVRMRSACEGIEEAYACALGQAAPVAGQASAPMPQVDLSELVQAAGWEFHPRAGGRAAVPLETSPLFNEAMLAAGDTVTASVAVPLPENLAPISAQAVGLLLLSVGGLFPLIRAQGHQTQDVATAELVASLGATPTPAELSRALMGLSMACRCGIREAAALANTDLAQAYLAARNCFAG